MKAVSLKRSGEQLTLTNYATQPLSEPAETAEQIAAGVKELLTKLGGKGGRTAAVTASHSDAILRIIEQPETPPHLLREGLRLNGVTLLNQDCRDFVLDCHPVESPADANDEAEKSGKSRRVKYIVGGLPRAFVLAIDAAFQKARQPIEGVQVTSASMLNAFEHAYPDVFKNEAFMLVNIGHESSHISIGQRGELLLERVLDFGGKSLVEGLMLANGGTREDALQALENAERQMIESARLSLNLLTREISSSIGFFEGRHEGVIRRLYASGGVSQSHMALGLITEEIGMPCDTWDPLKHCAIALPANQQAAFERDRNALHAACGAAIEALTEN